MITLSSFESNGDLSLRGTWVCHLRSTSYAKRAILAEGEDVGWRDQKLSIHQCVSDSTFVKLALCLKETGDFLLSLTS